MNGTRLAILITAGVFLAGCLRGQHLRKEDVEQFGTTEFKGSREAVFQATVEALEAMTIGVAVAKPEKGLIISKLFTLSESAYASGNQYGSTAQVVRDGLQYEITLESAGDEQTRVVARPVAYRNGKDVSEKPVWLLEGEYGQKPRWEKLFARISQMLP